MSLEILVKDLSEKKRRQQQLQAQFRGLKERLDNDIHLVFHRFGFESKEQNNAIHFTKKEIGLDFIFEYEITEEMLLNVFFKQEKIATIQVEEKEHVFQYTVKEFLRNPLLQGKKDRDLRVVIDMLI